MEDNKKGKVTGIRQIVRLKGFLQKWQKVTLGSKRSNNHNHPSSPSSSSSSPSKALPPNTRRPVAPPPNPRRPVAPPPPGGISPAISKRLISSSAHSDSDDDGCQSPEPPSGVPRGSLAVYVGPELRRFIIPTSYLGDPLFKKLLEKVEEEFGFDHSGALTIPCETETFKYLLKCMENHQREHSSAGSSDAMEE
nr:auxin-responsive protein SAUR61-like isoform X1 [Ipomoea batatas]GME16653.1 auxin-responsive protein SAUR61-like isoform X1 [Ipomoea batatas]